MLLVFVIMIVVTVCVTIVCTYFLLNSEDYRWLAFMYSTLYLLTHHHVKEYMYVTKKLLYSRTMECLHTFVVYTMMRQDLGKGTFLTSLQ